MAQADGKKPAPKGKTSEQQADRNRRIRSDRALGMSWETVAARHGVSPRRAQQVWNQAPEEPESTPSELLFDELALMNEVIERYAVLATDAEGDSNKLGALNGLSAMQTKRIDLERAMGLLPWRLATIQLATMRDAMFDAVDAALHEVELADPEKSRALRSKMLSIYESDPRIVQANEKRDRQRFEIGAKRMRRQTQQAQRENAIERRRRGSDPPFAADEVGDAAA
ncbi:MAG TPA: hypothetical protein VGL84_08375 [Gaiellaceae bacterium]|jgi:hypothetical protein